MGAAIQTLNDIIAIGDTIGLLPVQTGARADLGLLYARLGQVEIGRALAQEASRHAEQMLPMQAWVLAALARIELCAGRLQEAEKHLARARAWYDALVNGLRVLVPAWAEIDLAHAELQFAHVDYGASIASMDELLTSLHRYGVRPFVANALLMKAQALLALNRVVDAEHCLNEARTMAERIGADAVLWQILGTQCRLLEGRSERTAAAQCRDAASTIIQRLAATAPDETLRQLFLTQVAVQEVMGG